MDRQPARRFSMIRDFQLADFFTLLNGFAGTGAVLSFMGFLVTHRPRALLAGRRACCRSRW